jgi:putative inorganic carbon (hco3(-)) transporter
LGVFATLRSFWESFRQEHAVFAVTCLYLIFEYNRLHLAYPAIDIIPWGKTLLFLAIALAFMDRKSNAPPPAAVWPMLAFSACVLLSMVFAHSTAVATERWVDFFGWVFVVFLLTSVINTRRRLFLFIGVYFLINLKMAQHGFRGWANAGFGFSSWGVTGSPGWFQNPGEFSMQMALFLPMILAYILVFRRDWSLNIRLFFYMFAIMATSSIIASNARAGILGLAMVVAWFLLYSRQRIRALAIAVIAGAIIYQVMPVEFKERFETIGEDGTSVSRLMYWEYGKEAVRDNPLTGVGFRNWTTWAVDTHPELMGAAGARDRVEVIHNTYLEAATELGYPGAIVYILILLQILVTNHKSAQIAKKHNDRFLAATAGGLNGSLLVFMVPSYFMSVLYYPCIWILLALTISVSSICRNAEQTNRVSVKKAGASENTLLNKNHYNTEAGI